MPPRGTRSRAAGYNCFERLERLDDDDDTNSHNKRSRDEDDDNNTGESYMDDNDQIVTKRTKY